VDLRFYVQNTMVKETKEQLDIVNSTDDIKRIIACAGSGKTMVLTGNIIKILKDGLCSPDKILALTFTRNAAENMRVRIKENVKKDIDIEGINVFTFNSFGNEIISEHSFEFGLGKDFKIINNSQSWQILYEIFNESNLKYLKPGKKAGEFVQKLLNYIENLKNNLISVAEFEYYLNNYEKILSGYKSKALKNEEEKSIDIQRELFTIYQRYERRKIESNCIDYPDQVFMPYLLLRERKSMRAWYQQRYEYIFVDEFQDTNIAQAYLLSMLYKPGNNRIVVVGDDDQGIYSFRGASVENILNFHRLEEFKNSNVHDFFLTTNFRSGNNIINSINRVISSNSKRFKKELKSEDKSKPSEVIFYYKKTHEEEAAEIAGIIKYLSAGGIKLKQMAILARRKKFEKITGELEANGIKFELIGGKNFFFEPEILFIISWLRVIENINDEISIVYLLKSEKYKICDRDIFFIKRNYTDPSESINIIEGIADYKKNTYLSRETKERLGSFLSSLKLYISKSGELELRELISLIIEDSGIINELKSSPGPVFRKKIKNIENIIRVASDFQKSYIENNLRAFITFLKDVAKTDYDDPESVEFSGENSVKIMSIHAAKGLEFEVVFLPGLWKNDYKARISSGGFMVPSELRKDNSIYKRKKDFNSARSFSESLKDIKIEEERRIFYVGCSRAKKILILSSSEYEDNLASASESVKPKEIMPFFEDIVNSNSLRVINKEGLDFIRTNYDEKSYKDHENFKDVLSFINSDKKDSKNIRVQDENRWELYQKVLANRVIKSGDTQVENSRVQEIVDKINFELSYGSYPEDNINTRRFFPLTWIIDHKKCPLLYRWKHIYFIPEKESEQLARGEEVHGYLKNITLTGFHNKILKEKVMGHFDDKKIEKYLENFLNSDLWNFSEVSSIMLEQLFYWKIKDCYIVGRFDRVDIKTDNKLRIIDYKLSSYSKNKNNKNQNNLENSAGFQMKAYIAALSEIYSKPVSDIKGCIFYLGDGVEKSITVNSDEIKQLKKDILAEIKNIRDKNFKANFKNSCKKFCNYAEFCSNIINKKNG